MLGGSTTKVAGLPTQTVKVSGTLDVSSKSGKGGTIQVTGEAIEIKAATFDASGATGGGKVLIGGDTGGGHGHWAVASIPQAALEAGGGAERDHGEHRRGDHDQRLGHLGRRRRQGDRVGGRHDDVRRARSSRAAASSGGNGGFVEVSGKQTLAYFGHRRHARAARHRSARCCSIRAT